MREGGRGGLGGEGQGEIEGEGGAERWLLYDDEIVTVLSASDVSSSSVCVCMCVYMCMYTCILIPIRLGGCIHFFLTCYLKRCSCL